MSNEYDEYKNSIKECICCWYDLLGYGKPFIDSKWELDTETCMKNKQRIESLAQVFSGTFSVVLGQTFALNDGVVKNRDFNKGEKIAVIGMLRFVASLVWDYERINYMDKASGFPGARGVITIGKRFEYDSTNSHFDVARGVDIAYHPKEFQMNTAFSKAYIIEGSGSAKGLRGSCLFWDKEVFRRLADYVKASEYGDKLYCKDYDSENEHVFEIGDEIGWAFRCFFDIEPIEYNYQGIHTRLYKMIDSRTAVGTSLFG